MSKGKKILKIFGYGVISQVITLLLGIIIPKLMIVSYGSEVNGLLSSIRQVFVYVALLEAGIGTASLQALYAPIATNDKKRTCEIMSATNRYYKRTGIARRWKKLYNNKCNNHSFCCFKTYSNWFDVNWI